jgi:hypothetical protein
MAEKKKSEGTLVYAQMEETTNAEITRAVYRIVLFDIASDIYCFL